MAWAIYSAERFPGLPGSGRETEYLMDFGIQLPGVEAKTWFKLEDIYRREFWTDWEHAKDVDNPRVDAFSGKELGRRLEARYNNSLAGLRQLPRGLKCRDLDKMTEVERKAVEDQAIKENLVFRKAYVEQFESEFKQFSMGKPGRAVPTQYEMECYELLGRSAPEINPQAKEGGITNDLLAQLIDAAVAKKLEELTSTARK